MRRIVPLGFAMLLVTLAGPASAQDEPVVGSWRGTLKPTQGTESPIAITIVKNGDRYGGFTSGLSETSDVPLTRVTVSGTRASIESAAESRLGRVVLTGDLTAAGNSLKGVGVLSVGPQRFEVALELQRRPRPEVFQHRVEQGVDYFVGRWRFDYVGGEFPPLSAGSRTGTVTFARTGVSNFAEGQIEGDLLGKTYQERLSIGIDPDTDALLFLEHRADGTELVSLGNWRSPLAIVFQTAPVQTGGRTYQLRRVISVVSESAFELIEEFSVDAGPYRRLGNAHYTKMP